MTHQQKGRLMLSCELLVVLLLTVALGGNSPAEILAPRPVVDRFGQLVDGTGKVRTDAVVVVEDDRIVSVATRDAVLPADHEVIDMSRYTGFR